MATPPNAITACPQGVAGIQMTNGTALVLGGIAAAFIIAMILVEMYVPKYTRRNGYY